MSNKIVNKVCKQFLDGNICKTIKEYCKFREKAILNKTLYKELCNELRVNEKAILDDKWRVNIYDCLKDLVNIYENQTMMEKQEKNKSLINKIFSIIENSENSMYQELAEVKYAHLYLMLDIIWAYSDKDENKLQFSAIMHDMIGQVNEKDRQNSFYSNANEIIVRHTFDIIQIICKNQKREPREYIRSLCEQSNQNFVKEFVEKLEELVRQERGLEKTKNRRKEVWIKVGVAGLIIAMSAGGFVVGRVSSPLKQQLDEKVNEVLKLNRELQEYEQKQKEQREQIAELKKELFKLNNSGQDTETDEPEAETESELEDDTQSGDIQVDIQDLESQETEDENSQNGDSQQESESQETDSQTYTLPKERNVRSEKNTANDENILDVLKVGTVVTVLESEDEEGWMYIQYESEDGENKKGYIYVK